VRSACYWGHTACSAFNWGHTVTNVLGGWAAAVASPKLVLSCGVVVWSAFTILTPGAAATRSLPLLMVVRCCMGLGEGVAFPSMQVRGIVSVHVM
jgi:ACS family sodium-dependent inorganic phosphate cotransporter